MATLTKSYQLLASVASSTYSELRLYGKYNSQDNEDNESEISLQLRIYGNGGSGSFDSGKAYINESITNLSKVSYSKGSETNLKTLTYSVTHNSSGKYTATVTASLTTSAIPKGSLSASITLPTIPRTSSLSVENAYIGSTINVNIGRKLSTYTDTIKWSCGTLSGTLATKTSETQIPFTIPETIYEQIPNKQSATINWTITTYSGSTTIGTNTFKSNALVLESECKPLLDKTMVETNQIIIDKLGLPLTQIIFNLSQPKITLQGTPRKGATITGYNITCNDGQSYNQQEYQFNVILGNKLTLTVFDSRGLSTQEEIVLPSKTYEVPTIKTLSVKRVNPASSNVLLNMTGLFNEEFSIDDVTGNLLNISYRYKSTTDEEATWSNLYDINNEDIYFDEETNDFSITDLVLDSADCTYKQNFTFEFYISDSYSSKDTPSTGDIIKGIPTFNAGEHNFNVNGEFTISDEDGENSIIVKDYVEDTGWLDITLTNSFKIYNESSRAKYRKVGKFVEIRGTIAPKSEITSSAVTTITTLPEEFRPSYQINVVCQGSGSNKWLMQINTDGTVVIQRYGTTSYINIPTTAWLPFQATFFVD